ncbi:hypothetical protein BKP37_08760 [Anaerobacillus alkalilacustris]|uniref:DUF2680 domain-containing protein n=1 Tax=Anaerobacillus alkalilacustris TaxID=393763 RepID=A0A1S2LPL1_9BACI|nr:hypothetical protein [Anaerobacillus alkalilacustris]OIJ14421.1 hypothetical protein BKP37_08760 [Anaerobacillus alkalilacustris]
MKKAMVVSILTLGLLVLGAGNTLAMGEETQNGKAYGTFNFGQKLLKHENMTVHEVKEMYVNHHGTVGAAPSKKFTEHKQCMMMEE